MHNTIEAVPLWENRLMTCQKADVNWKKCTQVLFFTLYMGCICCDLHPRTGAISIDSANKMCWVHSSPISPEILNLAEKNRPSKLVGEW